jgi:hypothetical protein
MEIITRKEAQEQGLPRYFTGKPCKHGHLSEKLVSGGSCVECYTAKYYGDRERPKRHIVPVHLREYIMTRKKASESGCTTYFTGQPCQQGHVAARWTSSAQCVTCERDKSPVGFCCNKTSPIRRTDQYKKEYTRRYTKENAEKMRARVKAYQAQNKEKYLEYQNAYQAARRVFKRSAQPPWVSIDSLKKIYKTMRQKNKLAGYVAYHVDHIVPLQGKNVCGLHVPWNLQIITAYENQSKSNKWETN